MEKDKFFARNKRLFIIASIVLLLLVAILVIVLLISNRDKPKTKQEWLNDFQTAIKIDESIDKQCIVNSIEIWGNDIKVATYSQIFEVDLTGEKPKAHLIVEEQYFTLGTTEYNIYDEYYLINGVLHIKRIVNEEEITTNYPADINIFWEVVFENVSETKYSFTEALFSNLSIDHNNGHTMSADIPNANKSAFFGDKVNVEVINNASITMQLNSDSRLLLFQLEYDNGEAENNQKTIIKKTSSQLGEILINDWAGQA